MLLSVHYYSAGFFSVSKPGLTFYNYCDDSFFETWLLHRR